jgi:polyphosphate kinase 2 (PPK2 family)
LSIVLKQWESYLVRPGARIELGRIPARETRFRDSKKDARAALERYHMEIDLLAATLAAENQRALLVILQGTDASGKDGAVKRVFTGVNPQHCRVISFKPPDREEQEHDFLWRIVRALPLKGEIGIFNRLQYEDVVTLEARGKIPRSEATTRLRQIADMERAETAAFHGAPASVSQKESAYENRMDSGFCGFGRTCSHRPEVDFPRHPDPGEPR